MIITDIEVWHYPSHWHGEKPLFWKGILWEEWMNYNNKKEKKNAKQINEITWLIFMSRTIIHTDMLINHNILSNVSEPLVHIILA